MAWSIFQQGGGPSAAVQWAADLLASIGAPQTQGNMTFVYQWESSEGGGGVWNPLNQGPVPGHPELTSTGPQYGGGAADFVSRTAGLQGAMAYLNMPAYSGVLAGLKANNPEAAKQALWASPWAASHYGYGSNWSSATPQDPSGAPGARGSGAGTGQTDASGNPVGAAAGTVVSGVKNAAGAAGNLINCVTDPVGCAKATAGGWAKALLPWVIILGVGGVALIMFAKEIGGGKVLELAAPEGAAAGATARATQYTSHRGSMAAARQQVR